MYDESNIGVWIKTIFLSVFAFVLVVVGLFYFNFLRRFAGASGSAFGIYAGLVKVDSVNEFEKWFGHEIVRAMDFYPDESWQAMENVSWLLDPWAKSRYTMTFSIPMLPRDGLSNIAAGSKGEYNMHWQKIAQDLVSKGFASSTLRIGYDFNDTKYPWYPEGDPSEWVAYWREIVTTMRSVPNANFQFDWSVQRGPSSLDYKSLYPGDQFVDLIGVSAFNQSWISNHSDVEARWEDILNGPFGLTYWASFAKDHKKLISIPQWGTGKRLDGHGGGDDPYYIQKMYDFITHNDVSYHIYWDFCGVEMCSEISKTKYPLTGSSFKSLFGRLFR